MSEYMDSPDTTGLPVSSRTSVCSTTLLSHGCVVSHGAVFPVLSLTSVLPPPQPQPPESPHPHWLAAFSHAGLAASHCDAAEPASEDATDLCDSQPVSPCMDRVSDFISTILLSVGNTVDFIHFSSNSATDSSSSSSFSRFKVGRCSVSCLCCDRHWPIWALKKKDDRCVNSAQI